MAAEFDTAVFYLVWQPLGPEPLAHFLHSYRALEAGHAHRLLLILNGFDSEADLEPFREYLCRADGTVRTPHRMLDLAAYHYGASQVDVAYVCFVNSYSVLRHEGWLSRLRSAVVGGLGLAGTTGSWESTWTNEQFFNLHAGTAHLDSLEQAYPPFPNPHVRTTGFLMPRDLWLAFDGSRAVSKDVALRLESGYDNLTRWVQAQGQSVGVVGRDGVVHGPEAWPGSGTFRIGQQDNLSISDNRTDNWMASSPIQRLRFRELTWGCMTAMTDPELSRFYLELLDVLAAMNDLHQVLPTHLSSGSPLAVDLSDFARRCGSHIEALPPSDCLEMIFHQQHPRFTYRVACLIGQASAPAGYDETWRLEEMGGVFTVRLPNGTLFGSPTAALAVLRAWRSLQLRLAETFYRKIQTLPAPERAAQTEAMLACLPDCCQTQILAGHEARRRGDREASMDRYRRALTFDPDAAAAALGLARGLIETGQHDEARPLIARQLKLKPLHPQCLWLAAQARWSK